jgi:hypothetical protein
MRDLGACALLLCLFLSFACAPSVPSVGRLPPSSEAPDAADPEIPPPTTSPAPGGAAARGPSLDGSPRADAAAERPPGSDARVDGGATPVDARQVDAAADALSARPPRPGEIVIDELLVDPAGNDLGHEWIEIANVAPEPLDLSALHVADDATEAAAPAGVLAPGGLRVLGQSADRAHNGDAPVDVVYGTKISLNNGGDRISICVGPCAGGVALDAVAWTEPWGDAYAGHAVVIERGGATCPAAEAYGAGGNFGSPGLTNPPCPASPTRDGGVLEGAAEPGDAGTDVAGER